MEGVGAMQAAVVPLLLSTANVSGLYWDMVDGSALATPKTASFQVRPCQAAYLATSFHF